MDLRTPHRPGFARCARTFARVFALAAALVFIAWPARAEEPAPPSAPGVFRTVKEYESAIEALEDRIRRMPWGDERDREIAELAALRKRYDENTEPQSEVAAWVGGTLAVLGAASIGTGVFFITDDRRSRGGFGDGLGTAIGALCIGSGAGLGLIGVVKVAYGLKREMKKPPAPSASLQVGPGSLGVVGTF